MVVPGLISLSVLIYVSSCLSICSVCVFLCVCLLGIHAELGKIEL